MRKLSYKDVNWLEQFPTIEVPNILRSKGIVKIYNIQDFQENDNNPALFYGNFVAIYSNSCVVDCGMTIDSMCYFLPNIESLKKMKTNNMSIMKYHDWEYTVRHNADQSINFEINPNRECIIPKTFFKYYAPNEYSVDALTKSYIYASHPYNLNDPFDCAQDIIIFNNIQSVKMLLQDKYKKISEIYPSQEQQFQYAKEAFWTIFYRKCGIFSMTESADNEIMWSSYAQNSSGFCLEFDTKQFQFLYHGPFPMHYLEKITPIRTSEFGVSLSALVQTNIKHTDWSYEKEWRLLISNPNGIDMITFGPDADIYNLPNDHDRKFRYPIFALKSVILGINFFRKEYHQNRCNINDYDMIVIYEKECSQTRILDFLNEVTKKIPINVYIMERNDNQLNNLTKIPIIIIKRDNLVYNIIKTNKS